jgi:hypothetical protein
MSIKHFQWIRNNSIKLGESVDDAALLEVPKGFNNNILWNLGHLFVATENLLFKASGRETHFPEDYPEAFGGGTSPKTWTTEPPTKEEILSELADQIKRITETFEGHLDDALPKELNIASIEMKTVGDLLEFTTLHETIHFTTIKLYNQLLKTSN